MRVTAGSHAISVPVALAQTTTADIAAGCALALSGTVTGGQALAKSGAGALTLSGDNTLGAVTVTGGTVLLAGGTSTCAGLSLADATAFSQSGGTLTLEGGLTVAGSANYDLLNGVAKLLLKRGSDGGAVDTVSDVTAAVAAGQLRARGLAAPLSAFRVSEVDAGGTIYVQVALKAIGTLLSVK